MLKAKGKSGGGSSKSKSKGGKGASKTRSRKLQTTTHEHILAIRAALFNDDGSDRDVLKDFQPFTTYNRNDLDVTLSFSTKLAKGTLNAALDIHETNMTPVLAEAGFDFSRDDQRVELKEQANRFILIHDKPDEEDGPAELVGYVQFRFTFQGEFVNAQAGASSLFVWDIQLKQSHQCKGLGKHLMSVVELIARKNKMAFMQVLLPEESDAALDFITDKLNGFELDEYTYAPGTPDDEFYIIYQKALTMPKKPAAAAVKPVAASAVSP